MSARVEPRPQSSTRSIRLRLRFLIKEARERQWRRRRRWIVLVLAVTLAFALFGGFGRSGGGGSVGHGATTAPADLPARSGWFVGSADVPTSGCGGCIQTASWASTIPYLDGPNDLPVRTMKALGPHDLILQVSRSWQRREPAWALKAHALRIHRRSVHAGFEGNPTRNRVSEWAGVSWVNGSAVEVYAWFGSPTPTAADIRRMQQELDGTHFPQWRVLAHNDH